MKKKICAFGFVFLISISSLFARMNLKVQTKIGPVLENDEFAAIAFPFLGISADYDFPISEYDFLSAGIDVSFPPAFAVNFSYIKCLQKESDSYKKWFFEPTVHCGIVPFIMEFDSGDSDDENDSLALPLLRFDALFVRRPEKNGFVFGVGPAVTTVFVDKEILWSPELSFEIGYRF